MGNKGFIIGAVGLAVAALLYFTLTKKDEPLTTTSNQAGKPTSSESLEAFKNADYWIRPYSPRFGNEMARVTVVEWLDPECEACRAMHSIVKKIISDYESKVMFVIRYMPYHKNSLFAASALEEAREMGKFGEALDLLFEKQPLWGDHAEPKPELIPEYLSSIGIPRDRLGRVELIKKHKYKIDQDQEDGDKAGVQGTPSFFINGKALRQLGDEPLRAAIDRALAEAQ